MKKLVIALAAVLALSLTAPLYAQKATVQFPTTTKDGSNVGKPKPTTAPKPATTPPSK